MKIAFNKLEINSNFNYLTSKIKLTQGQNKRHFFLDLRKLHVIKALETTQFLQEQKKHHGLVMAEKSN